VTKRRKRKPRIKYLSSTRRHFHALNGVRFFRADHRKYS
jgi:hypothetical protein